MALFIYGCYTMVKLIDTYRLVCSDRQFLILRTDKAKNVTLLKLPLVIYTAQYFKNTKVFFIVSAARSLIVSAARSLIVSAARSLTCRDDLDSKWRLLLAENEQSRVSLLSRISIGN